MEEMVNFTAPHPSANFLMHQFWQIGAVEMCLLIFSFLSGVSTHGYVIYLIVAGTGSGLASEFFILNLSVCEIIFALNSLLNVLTITFQSLIAFTCFLLGEVITGRPLFQCLICVERYLAVVHPVTFLKFKPLRYRLICSSAVWIIVLGSCVTCMFLLTSFSFPIYALFFSIQFLVFLSVQLFCCVAVLRALKQSGPGERVREREEENHMKRRAFIIILITTASTIIMYVPYIITGIFTVTQYSTQNFQVLLSLSFVCFVLAGFVQPVLYLHRTGKLSCSSDIFS